MFLNQIFYSCNKFDNIESLEKLEKYMLDYKNIYTFIDSILINDHQTLSTPSSSTEPPLQTLSSLTPEFRVSVPSPTPLRLQTLSIPASATPLRLQTKETILSLPSSTPSSVTNSFDSFVISRVSHLSSVCDSTSSTNSCVFDSRVSRLSSVCDSTSPTEPLLKKHDIYFPLKEDSLFWCIFISFYGWKEYEYIGKKYANRELDEKKKIMENIKKSPSIMKETNIKVTNVMIQEILSDLLLNKKTSLNTFLAFVSYYKKRVFIVKKNTYLLFTYNNTGFVGEEESKTEPRRENHRLVGESTQETQEFVGEEESKTEPIRETLESKTKEFVIIYYNEETKSYGLYKECISSNSVVFDSRVSRLSSVCDSASSTNSIRDSEPTPSLLQDTVKDIIENKFLLSSISKPLKGVSTYKVCEIEEIAKKINLVWDPAIKKNDLYNLVYNECQWT